MQSLPAQRRQRLESDCVNLKVVLPDKIDPELEAFVTNWAAVKAENPRAGMER
jgi:hypothetical protein